MFIQMYVPWPWCNVLLVKINNLLITRDVFKSVPTTHALSEVIFKTGVYVSYVGAASK